MARWDDEKLVFEMPDINKIQCKNCFLREKDRTELGIKGATLAICDAYDHKPKEILWDGEDCPYFIDENEEDEDESN